MNRDEKVCVIYHYFEKNDTYKRNFQHFMSFGILEHVSYYIVLAGAYTVNLPKLKNVSYIFSENENYDYGGHSLAVERHIDSECYDYFMFINCSVRGPFISPCSSTNWLVPFLRLLGNEVGLVGSTINILSNDSPHSKFYKSKYGGNPPYVHVQTAVFAINKRALMFLEDKKFFNFSVNLTREEVVSGYEIRLSRLILESGWNIKCLLPEYNSIDYRNGDVININPSASDGDVAYPGSYFGRSIHPYETIFIKTERCIWPESYLDSLAFSMSRAGLGRSVNGSAINISDMCRKNVIFFGRRKVKKTILSRIKELLTL